MKALVTFKRPHASVWMVLNKAEAERLYRSIATCIEWEDGTVTRFATVQYPALGTAGGV